jgi:heat shock protein HslJ
MKAAEPEAPLPEAPSASKRAELAATAPEASETAPKPEAESTSRPDRPSPNKPVTPLAGTQWKLIQLNGQDVVIASSQKPMTLAFSPEGRRIAGSAGCNSYLGIFSDDHGLLHLNPGNMTMMSCADPAGSREKKFIAMLRSVDGYKISGDFLLLTSNGKTVAKFKNNPPL